MTNKFTSPLYRADIDGLRAIAIIAVVLFHAYPEWFISGFVGVDIFFVISGFLITGIIIRELKNNTFSFANFFARRIKRIFPGLILILSFCLMIGWLVLLPHEFKQLSKNVQSGALFIANFRFYKEAGYFDLEALQKPLLHLWSLGIEEQYYIFWPILLYFAFKKRYSLLGMTLLLGFISFGLNILLIQSKPDFVFYLPHTRFWELLIGSALVFIPFPSKGNFFFTNISTTIGLILIIFSIFMIKEGAQYPGFLALLPLTGAFLVIISGSQAWLNKYIFSHRYLVAIGLISFPLYLWHWPLLAFVRILNSETPSYQIRFLIILMSFILATITYYFVEKPIRKKGSALAIPLFLLILLIAGFSIVIKNKKFPTFLSYNPEINKLEAAIKDWDFPGSKLIRFNYKDLAFYKMGTGLETILFFGDSNIQQYAPRITHLISTNTKNPKTVIFATQPGCPPILNIYSTSKHCKCFDFVDKVIAYAEEAHINTIVLGAQWLGYFGSPSYYFKELRFQEMLFQPQAEEKAYLALEETIQRLQAKHKKIYIILNIPVGPEFDPLNLMTRSLNHLSKPKIVSSQEKVYFSDSNKVTTRLKAIAKKYQVTVLDPKINLCQNNLCDRITAEGNPIYKDKTHLRPFYVERNITFLDNLILKSL